MDRAGGAVDAINARIERAAEQSTGDHQDFHGQPMEITVDKNSEPLTDAVSPVGIELAAFRVGIDRYLEFLTSTVGFEEFDDRRATSPANHRRGLFCHINLHVTVNPYSRPMIPRPCCDDTHR